MYIKSLELNNFQAHEHLTLTFNESVTVICGPSSVGKSCIRRGISFLLFGEPHSDAIRKIGTKQTSVKALLSTGWEVERIKSASVNRVIISKDGVTKTFDAIGANIPDEVKAVLQVRELEIDKETINLNIAKQLTLPFLYDKPATFRAKLFNMLTGNDLVDRVVQNFNKELLSISRDLKVNNEFINNNSQNLSELEKLIEGKKKVYAELVQKTQQLKDNYKRLEKLQQIDSKFTEIDVNVKLCIDELKKYSKSIDSNKLEEIKKKNEKLSTLKNGLQCLKVNKEALESSSLTLSNLRSISPEKTQEIKASVERLAKLKEGFDNLKDNEQTYARRMEELPELTKIIETLTFKYRDLVKEAPICDKCGQIIQTENIVKHL